jgi:DMSO/TMAO reductase YedYZ molybdopterin-dependent catalytic subunit
MKGMDTRRKFLVGTTRFVLSLGLLPGAALTAARGLWASAKRVILPRETQRESLIHRNPAQIDTRNLEVTPLQDFGTMGLTEHEVDMESWRLEVAGYVENPLRLTHKEILAMPSMEREVLLICPGVFANNGRWKGVSIKGLLERARVRGGVNYVDIGGPEGPYEKVVRCAVEDVFSDKVFLAHGVNGQDLPVKHGFPLRVVAEDFYGYDWVKYVYRVTAVNRERA